MPIIPQSPIVRSVTSSELRAANSTSSPAGISTVGFAPLQSLPPSMPSTPTQIDISRTVTKSDLRSSTSSSPPVMSGGVSTMQQEISRTVTKSEFGPAPVSPPAPATPSVLPTTPLQDIHLARTFTSPNFTNSGPVQTINTFANPTVQTQIFSAPTQGLSAPATLTTSAFLPATPSTANGGSAFGGNTASGGSAFGGSAFSGSGFGIYIVLV